MANTANEQAEDRAATDEIGAEWGSPPEISEFPPETEPAEPLHEPGPNDEAR